MHSSTIINDFISLGQYFKGLLNSEINDFFHGEKPAFDSDISWFTKSNVYFALNAWSELLQRENIAYWLDAYDFKPKHLPKSIGVIMAGNLPLVGLHDLLCVVASGNRAVIKLSSKDHFLMTLAVDFLRSQSELMHNSIAIAENINENSVDAVIATGSDNSARYFEYNFPTIPALIRRNRSSLAVLSGNESLAQMEHLADDVFLHFGMGCRNVSLILMPESFDESILIKALSKYSQLTDNKKYSNALKHVKARFELLDISYKDHGFFLSQPLMSLHAPIGVLNLFSYSERAIVDRFISEQRESIQCVVSSLKNGIIPETNFGDSQKPELSDYADGADTIKFLLEL